MLDEGPGGVVEQTDVQAAVDRLASRLGQSILVEDRDQHPLWWSTQGEVDGTRTRTIVERRVDATCRRIVRDYHLVEATAPVQTPVIPEADMWARWCMPLRHEGRHLGFLWVLDPEDTIGQADLGSIVECAELAAAVVSKSQRTTEHDRRLRDELVDRLCHRPDPEAARDLTRLEHLPHDARVQVEAPARTGGWRLSGSMSAHVATGRPRAATSGAPVPLVDLAEAVRRAGAVRRVIAAGGRPSPATWDGLRAWRLIVDAPDSLTVAQLHPAAETLVSQTKSEFATTARVVVDHGGDVTSAAHTLHVHRTTLYYRLDRIAELTGVDLRDGNGRTDLQLALWLAAYRGVES